MKFKGTATKLYVWDIYGGNLGILPFVYFLHQVVSTQVVFLNICRDDFYRPTKESGSNFYSRPYLFTWKKVV